MFLAIDASTKSTGIAVFDNDNLIKYQCYTSAKTNVIDRIYQMTSNIDNLLSEYNSIDTIVLEEVRPDQGEYNSKTLKALFWLQAAFAFLLHDKYPMIKIEYIYPTEWRSLCGIKTGKGLFRQELKQSDIQFVNKTYNITNINDDIADAICIGYAYQLSKKQKTVKEIKFNI